MSVDRYVMKLGETLGLDAELQAEYLTSCIFEIQNKIVLMRKEIEDH